MDIKRIEQCCTGGGFYSYRGQLADGRYFMAGTDAYPEIVDADPFAVDWDELHSYEWNSHYTGELPFGEEMYGDELYASMLPEVETIERCYTGGGIYIYRGRFKDGRWFFSATLAETVIIDVNPFEHDWDVMCDCEWMLKHSNCIDILPEDLDGDDLWDATPEERRIG